MPIFTIKPLLYLTIAIFLCLSKTTVAKVEAVTGQLTIVAILDGKPAFQSVLWRLKSNSRSDSKPIHVYKHTATLDLEPGKYQISVSLGNKTHTQEVTIKESSKQELIVSMD